MFPLATISCQLKEIYSGEKSRNHRKAWFWEFSRNCQYPKIHPIFEVYKSSSKDMKIIILVIFRHLSLINYQLLAFTLFMILAILHSKNRKLEISLIENLKKFQQKITESSISIWRLKHHVGHEYVWKSRYFFRQGCGTTLGVQPRAIPRKL